MMFLTILITLPMIIYGWSIPPLKGFSGNMKLSEENFITPNDKVRRCLRSINRVMMDPELPVRSRHVIESMLYKRYEQWAIKIGSNFKKQHFYKCRHIPYHEMAIYSRTGLLNAIRLYHPTKESAMFHLFAVHHIRGQLYKGMTDLSPIVNVSKKQLRHAGTVYARASHYTANLPSQSHQKSNHPDPQVLWSHIEESVDPFTRRCITYKFNYDFDTIRSNKEVAFLMECSEEMVRSNILQYFIDQQLGIILVKCG